MSNPEQLPRRIFLVDDHPIVRRGLIEIINHEPDLQVAGEAADPDGLWPALGAAAPDLVILDLSLGPHDGIELLARIRSDFGVPVLVLTMHDEIFQAERAFRAGARGFVIKRDASTELLAAIRQVLAGEVFLSGRLSENVPRLLRDKLARSDGLTATLSPREMQVLWLLGHGSSSHQVARELGLSAKTVDTHRLHIRAKLGLRDSSELALFAVQWALDREEP